MSTHKRVFRLAVLLALMTVPASFVQARPHKRKPKARPALHAQAFTISPGLLGIKQNAFIRALERQRGISRMTPAAPVTLSNIRTHPRLAGLIGTSLSERLIIPKTTTTNAGFATFAIADTRPEWLKKHMAERHDPWRNLTGVIKQKCEPSLSVGAGLGVANVGYTRWKDNHYGSVALGWSAPDVSASFSRGMCEPPTGVFVNATLVSPLNQGKVNSFTWYYGKEPSFERTYSTPTAGASVGVTFKIWSGGNKTS